MRNTTTSTTRQPEPVSAGITKQMVREHRLRLYQEKLLVTDPPTMGDWVLAEWNLAESLRQSAHTPSGRKAFRPRGFVCELV